MSNEQAKRPLSVVFDYVEWTYLEIAMDKYVKDIAAAHDEIRRMQGNYISDDADREMRAAEKRAQEISKKVADIRVTARLADGNTRQRGAPLYGMRGEKIEDASQGETLP